MKGRPPYNREQELVWIKQAQEDSSKFGFLYEYYYGEIIGFVYKRIGDKQLSADICHNVFLKAQLNIKKYKDMGFPFGSWLYKMANNETNMFFRKNKHREVEVNERDAFELMGEVGDENGERKINLLLELIGNLSDEQNELITFRFFDKLSFQEMAGILNTTEAALKMRVKRILEKLKIDLINLLNR